MSILANARVVTPGGVLDPGWVRVEGERIAAVGAGPAPAGDMLDLAGWWVLPGFVDLHVHGGGGGSCAAGDPAGTLGSVAFHARAGTTTTLASLVTAPLPALVAATSALADLADDGVVAGIHLEGPFLAAARCGAQNPAWMVPPDRDALARLLDAGRGHVRMVTLAPELPGGLDLVRDVVAAGAVAAVGHTDASYEAAKAAFDAGATVATHLFNGMPPLHHRSPGAVGAALERESVVCEVIPDGAHLHDAAVRLVLAAAGAGRVAAVTDAIAAAGRPDGDDELGGLAVRVTGGVARLAAGGSLAGSTLTTGGALRRLVAAGVGIETAAAMLATTPARALDLADRCGAIAPGLAADLVVCRPDLGVAGVLAAGRWVSGRAPDPGEA